MKVVFFAHPLFLGSHSMSRFASMLAEGMQKRGHQTEIWRPESYFSKLPGSRLKKWLGYLDQYLIFPLQSKLKIKQQKDILYVLTDHALGPYAPLISNLPHVIHCHDFLAQRSALGEIQENPTSKTGRLYQRYIRRGYSVAKNFISVSERTRTDLEEFLPRKPNRSEMIYNGLSSDFGIFPKGNSRIMLGEKLRLDLSNGYMLHIGGNQWYKNRMGILLLYESWRNGSQNSLPLIMIGEQPDAELNKRLQQCPYKSDIHFFSGVDSNTLRIAYAGASIFLFPSLAEGFGWPIAEAMASGTLVITTNEAPMTEVAGDAAFLIDRMPFNKLEQEGWANRSAAVLDVALNLTPEELDERQLRNKRNVERFDMEKTLDHIEQIYLQVLNENASSV